MSKGLTIAEMVQQVLYAMYKVRLDVTASEEPDEPEADYFHCHSDKFKEIVMEANFMLQELQKEQDWHFLRERWDIGHTHNSRMRLPQEVHIPDWVYKLCTGYGDCIRLHRHHNIVTEIPIEEARSGNRRNYEMFDGTGRANVDLNQQRAFVVGDTLTFYRRWLPGEMGFLETDVIRYIEPLHICDDSCPARCPKAYDEKHFQWLPDPYYVVVRTAARRAVADPSLAEMVQVLTDESTKFLSAMRENDSAHTTTDTYDTAVLGYVPVL